MDGKRLIERIRLTNFLSFGPEGEEIALEPLNVLIGPNLSGKSNFLAAFELLEALPRAPSFSRGVSEYLWKGAGAPSLVAGIDAIVSYPAGSGSLRYRFCFGKLNNRLKVANETVESVPLNGGDPTYFYRFDMGLGVIEPGSASRGDSASEQRAYKSSPPETARTDQSVLHQPGAPDRYPELNYLASQFSQIGLFIEGWNLEASSPPKMPVDADEQHHFLMESGKNLALVLNDLCRDSSKKVELIGKLRKVNERIEDIHFITHRRGVGIAFQERGLNGLVSARHISDGTLRFLMLLAVLCHPNPPPLVCIDEPEHGLHPDALHLVADLLRDAAQRCQIIATTHSDVLISALSDIPEAVIVCERDEAGTHLGRLDGARLTDWLESYTLGDLWQMGEIGGRQ